MIHGEGHAAGFPLPREWRSGVTFAVPSTRCPRFGRLLCALCGKGHCFSVYHMQMDLIVTAS
jgi:hypothetical protein